MSDSSTTTADFAVASTTRFATEDPAKYIRRLCKHFNHKVPAEWNEQKGYVQFPMGDCYMTAGDSELHLKCLAGEAAALETLQGVVGIHIEQLAWKEKPEVVWAQADV